MASTMSCQNDAADTTSASKRERILIIDFGSQVSHLICRRVREAGVYCELRSCRISASEVQDFNPMGVILSGGPYSVYDSDAPHLQPEVWKLIESRQWPMLGICYGLQEICHHLGGQVEAGQKREFGSAQLRVRQDLQTPGATPEKKARSTSVIFKDIEESAKVWMSHGDKVTRLPEGFQPVAATDNCENAAVESRSHRMWGVQFHPEVTHTLCGPALLKNFVQDVCGCTGVWNMHDFAQMQADTILSRIGDRYVIGAVSGGVDSSVAAALVHKAIGERFKPFMVDTGLLRKDEAKECKTRLEQHIPGLELMVIDARKDFYSALKGVSEPEKKRKIIGGLFITCFEKAIKQLGVKEEECFLLQGTLYPDVIESTSFRGPSTTIKTHHNVGGLPEHMKMELIEPLRLLFKDEVRALGRELGLPEESVMRHPFPGPGLGIRIIGEVTEEAAESLRAADDIFLTELRKAGLYNEIGQAFAVILPTVKSVGVMGDHRTYESVCVLRAVTTLDFMTADWFHMPPDLLAHISNRISNEVKGINRVCYDVSSKPPATIEWE